MLKRDYVDVIFLNTKESELIPKAFYRKISGVRERYDIDSIYDIKRSQQTSKVLEYVIYVR